MAMKFTLLASSVGLVASHSRMACPASRNMNGFDSTSIKYGPCGDDTGNFDFPVIDIQPGPLTINVQESIQHVGSGWTFYLSEDGDDMSRCLLLDHIPAWSGGGAFPVHPNPLNEDYWDQYYFTLEIPDVACEKCSIQMSNLMMDKSGDIGAPDGEGCTYDGFEGTCTLNPGGYGYHSCSLPLRINGTIPRSEYQCPGQPQDWPTEWEGDDGVTVDASVVGLYRRETGPFKDGFVDGVPERFSYMADMTAQLYTDGLCPRANYCIGGDLAACISKCQVEDKRCFEMCGLYC